MAAAMATKAGDWLAEARAGAMSTFRSLPMPDRASHLWRYSDPADFLPLDAGAAGGDGAAAGGSDLLSQAKTSIDIDATARSLGVIAVPLAIAATETADLVRAHLGRIVVAETGKMEALNAATWSSGYLVRVPRHVQCTTPIRISTDLDGAFGAVRNLILIEEGASATIVEDASGDGVKGTRRIEATEVFAAAGSHVRLVSVQRLGRNGTLHRTERVRLDRGARASIVMVSFGAGNYKADVGVVLDGEGSESRMIGLCFGDGKQRADHHTLQDHRGPHTSSDIDFRVVLGGRARSAYTGLIRIAQEAPYCEAYQENRNLLLSDNAKAESIPELEILTDEVRCKHGATVGPIDPDQLFYIRSRGLSAAEATRMVVTGFLETTLAHIPEGLQEPIREELARRLVEVVRA